MYQIFFDLETTGLDITKESPIQIGAIACDEEFKVLDSFNHYVKTNKPLDPFIVNLTGITDEKLAKEGLAPKVVAEKWNNFIWKYQPCSLIGYNSISYDYPLLCNWLYRHVTGNFKLPPVHMLEDYMRNASVYFKTKKWLKLSATAERLGIDFEKGSLHGALADATLTKEIAKKLEHEIIWKVLSKIGTNEEK